MSDQKISKDEIQQLAHLARVELKPESIESLQTDLSKILDYVHSLQALDLSHVEPTTHGSPVSTPLREDVVQASLSIDDALAVVPQKGNSAFVVPKVVG
ncbi:MAG TPA: Asp-tRNA(Asn)/Glu-tRNA(Gln) amidotransferase subunit GatC [Myxococcales bacterium]|nr:Asp-tRNA(Asn)/Glu-tRNA(Gln) amidotransferase subunit GatC [Myxococcales bacterium]